MLEYAESAEKSGTFTDSAGCCAVFTVLPEDALRFEQAPNNMAAPISDSVRIL